MANKENASCKSDVVANKGAAGSANNRDFHRIISPLYFPIPFVPWGGVLEKIWGKDDKRGGKQR